MCMYAVQRHAVQSSSPKYQNNNPLCNIYHMLCPATFICLTNTLTSYGLHTNNLWMACFNRSIFVSGESYITESNEKKDPTLAALETEKTDTSALYCNVKSTRVMFSTLLEYFHFMQFLLHNC